MKKTIYLVDASAMFFRAYFAIRPLSSKSGIPTNAIYGYLAMLVKLLIDKKADYVAVCYDLPGPSFRNEIDSEYKAHRPEAPEDLQEQFPYMKKITELLGLPAFERQQYEADDIIGSLARFAQDNGCRAVIVSGDKDFAQLICDQVTMFDTMKNVEYTPEKVVEKWGVPPEQFKDYLAIVGDSSDNIRGVKGVGVKGAQKLLSEYRSLEDIYEHIDDIKGATQKKLIDGKESAFLSRKLVDIVQNLEVVNDLEELRVRPQLTEELQELLDELNFKTLKKQLNQLRERVNGDSASNASATKAAVQKEYRNFQLISLDVGSLSDHLKPQQQVHLIEAKDQLFIFTETTAYQLKQQPSAYAADLDKMDLGYIGFDLKTLWHKIGLAQPRAEWDHMVAAYVANPLRSKGYNDLIEHYEIDESVDEDDIRKLANASFELIPRLEEAIDKAGGEGIYRGLELPLIAILYRMEKKGFLIDTELLAEQSQELQKQIESLESEIHKLAGEEFNVASPKQLATILFEKLSLKKGKKTKTGYSTDNEVLQKLSGEHPICDKVLSYRELAKIKSTYLDALPKLVDQNQRLHTTLRQAHTTTGRLASYNPNLQNIPIRSELGARVRRAFVAPQGLQLASVDYSQIELRILAHMTGDRGLCEAFENDLDIHAATASEIYGVSLKQVTAEQRRHAKAVNFGIAYGQGAYGLAEALGISRSESKDIIKRYFEKFPGVQEYIHQMMEDAKSKGFVETLFGRRRYIPELKDKNPAVRKFGERAAINAPIQGTAADLVKKAMIKVASQIQVDMLLQVHDELIFEGSAEQFETDLPKVVKTMESISPLSVPLKVNAHIGQNWDEAH